MPQKKALVLVGIAQALFAALLLTVIVLLILYFRPATSPSVAAPKCVDCRSWRSYNLSEIDPEAALRVKEINSHQYAWKARISASSQSELFKSSRSRYRAKLRYRDLLDTVEYPAGTFSVLEHRLRQFGDVRPSLEHVNSLLNDDVTLPDHFDARERWPLCKAVHSIRNQGECGSCWAFAFSSAASDRICIHSNGSTQVQLSAQDLIECSEGASGHEKCLGGSPDAAARAWHERGIVSGGPFSSNEGCKPYMFTSDCGSPCPLLETAPHAQEKLTTCLEKCRPGFHHTYNEDKHFGGRPYIIGHPKVLNAFVERSEGQSHVLNGENLTSADLSYQFDDIEKIVKLELFRNGPFTLSFPAHVEFQYYAHGVYHRTPYDGGRLYGHMVKLIGWGEEKFEHLERWVLPKRITKTTVENGKKVYWLPYWTFANSFGTDWGENGFFRVPRGPFADPQLVPFRQSADSPITFTNLPITFTNLPRP